MTLHPQRQPPAPLPTVSTSAEARKLADNLMAAMSDVEPQDSGLASGIANTAFMMAARSAWRCSRASRRPARIT